MRHHRGRHDVSCLNELLRRYSTGPIELGNCRNILTGADQIIDGVHPSLTGTNPGTSFSPEPPSLFLLYGKQIAQLRPMCAFQKKRCFNIFSCITCSGVTRETWVPAVDFGFVSSCIDCLTFNFELSGPIRNANNFHRWMALGLSTPDTRYVFVSKRSFLP